jgi:DUF4097 and DUF4098 domain-containing protein YvlB
MTNHDQPLSEKLLLWKSDVLPTTRETMFCRTFVATTLVLLVVVAAAGCSIGPTVSGSFDRTLSVSGPIRLELTSVAGDVAITGSADGKVHVHGDVRASGMTFDDPQKRLDEIVASPPIEQSGSTIRVGEYMTRMHNLTIAYTIEVPRETEVSTRVISGSQIVTDVHGPVKAEAASGSIRVEHTNRDVQLTTISGSIALQDIGSDARVSTVSGSVIASNIKGDVRIHAISGAAQVTAPGGRADASTASGSIDIEGASSDVKAHAASGRVKVQGSPGAATYWDLKTVSGEVQIAVPKNASFRLSAEAMAGEIRADIPVMIEEQSKHSLRARAGTGGGRIEIHTVSGGIQITGAK